MSLITELSQSTPIFGLPLWILVGTCTGVFIVLVLFISYFCFTFLRRKSSRAVVCPERLPADDQIRVVSQQVAHGSVPDQRPEIQIDIGKMDEGPMVSSDWSSFQARGKSRSKISTDSASSNVSNLGWGYWFTLRELEEATNRFDDECVIGWGSFGIVYRGILPDNTVVAVKKLFIKRECQVDKFRDEVEAMGHVRHKNLVRLLGYCVEGAYGMLVYEHVENGNLDHWLHGDVGQVSPLTWDTRMKIILGTAKGLAYLHEGLEPMVVHQDVKSCNILLDRQWNPKVSDFGFAKLLSSERSRIMGTSGYIAPEYAFTGMLNERSDIYSFGVLIMEIISGRRPIDYSRPFGEVNLVEWIKTMSGNRNCNLLVDPKLPESPPSKILKQVVLFAISCTDPDPNERPKMGRVIHMLEANDEPSNIDHWTQKVSDSRLHHQEENQVVATFGDKKLAEEYGTSEEESNRNRHYPMNYR